MDAVPNASLLVPYSQTAARSRFKDSAFTPLLVGDLSRAQGLLRAERDALSLLALGRSAGRSARRSNGAFYWRA